VFVGIALGLRYKVVILIRAVALVMMFALVVGIARGDPFWSIILAIAVPATAIQFGYLAGIQIRAAAGGCSYDRQSGYRAVAERRGWHGGSKASQRRSPSHLASVEAGQQDGPG